MPDTITLAGKQYKYQSYMRMDSKGLEAYCMAEPFRVVYEDEDKVVLGNRGDWVVRNLATGALTMFTHEIMKMTYLKDG